MNLEPCLYSKMSATRYVEAPEWLKEGWYDSGQILKGTSTTLGALRPSYNAVLKNPSKIPKPPKRHDLSSSNKLKNSLVLEIEKNNYSNQGFYRLKGITLEATMLCDIDIMLLNKNPAAPEAILKTKSFEAIVEHLTGIGRITFYSSNR